MLRSPKRRIVSLILNRAHSRIGHQASFPFFIRRYWSTPYLATLGNTSNSSFLDQFSVNTNITQKHRNIALVLVADIEHVKFVLDEVQLLEDLLEQEIKNNYGKVTNNSVHLRGAIQHLVTNHDFLESLGRLESKKERSLLGLSSEEHDLLLLARKKVNTR
jgi:hypothetical protein